MKAYSFVLICLLIFPSITGCFGSNVDDTEEEEETGFSWPENERPECTLSDEINFQCYGYLIGFTTPVQTLTNPVDGNLWIVDLEGKISSWDSQDLVSIVDMSDMVSNCHNEQGLLSMAFTDDFVESKKVLLSFVKSGPCENVSPLIIAEATVMDGEIQKDSINTLLQIEQVLRNHNGGYLLPVGGHQYLLGVGDGGGSNDPESNSQNTSSQLGAMLLFSYSNSTISPVVNNNESDPYILHHGLRNPWRFDLHPAGGLLIADVGQNCYEELNYIPVFSNSTNFGWSEREGMHYFEAGSECDQPVTDSPENMTDPVLEYDHEEGKCSITGGEWMDWGNEAFRDGYLYGDFCSGTIWLAKQTVDGWESELIVDTDVFIVGFGRGLNDELLLFSWSGEIFLLESQL